MRVGRDGATNRPQRLESRERDVRTPKANPFRRGSQRT